MVLQQISFNPHEVTAVVKKRNKLLEVNGPAAILRRDEHRRTKCNVSQDMLLVYRYGPH